MEAQFCIILRLWIREIVEMLIHAGANVNQANRDGLTPLQYASRSVHTKIVEILIRAGANVNQANRDGLTPLHYMSQYIFDISTDEVRNCKNLISAGANVNQATKNGLTPF